MVTGVPRIAALDCPTRIDMRHVLPVGARDLCVLEIEGNGTGKSLGRHGAPHRRECLR